MVSFYTGLRAKEITALVRSDLFKEKGEEGTVRGLFILSAAQSKGGKTRTVYFNQ
jgi:integrase/recombinase XerD